MYVSSLLRGHAVPQKKKLSVLPTGKGHARHCATLRHGHASLTALLGLCKADQRQYSSSRASVTDKQNATSSRVSSLHMTPIHWRLTLRRRHLLRRRCTLQVCDLRGVGTTGATTIESRCGSTMRDPSHIPAATTGRRANAAVLTELKLL